MKKLIFLLIIAAPLAVFSQTNAPAPAPAAPAKPADKSVSKNNFLPMLTAKTKQKAQDKKENLKTLSEKYAKADAAQKPALEKQMKDQLSAQEDDKIAFTKELIRRNEEKTKALQENLDTLQKTKDARVSANLDALKKGDTKFLDEQDTLQLPPKQPAVPAAAPAQTTKK